MKELLLSPNTYKTILKGQCELYPRDFKDNLHGCAPGEWVVFKTEKIKFLGYVNPFSTNHIQGRVVDVYKNEDVETVLHNLISSAIQKRKMFKSFNDGCRLIYGQADNLPGVIVDSYQNAVLLQINTAGMDRYREFIKSEIASSIDRPVFFLDDIEYRKSEVLPIYDRDELPPFIEVKESGFNYHLDSSMIQKIGYYYDHRFNRRKLENMLNEMNHEFHKGLDLFSYMGSWGLHALRSGVEHITFVDQGNFENIYNETMKLNDISADRWNFSRGDVFKFLDEVHSRGEKFDLIISDPPAFKKNENNKAKSLGGYFKLHSKILNVIAPNGLVVVASCTHGVSEAELDKTFLDACVQVGRTARLIDSGVQGADHPFSNLNSNSHYIKYLLYQVD